MADGRPKRRSGPPDFIGVGTLQSGTGWWNRMLLRHPEVQSRRRGKRSLHFFDAFCERPMTDADVAEYHRAFRRRRAGRITGEWTSRYTYDPWTPPLLARAAPDAKLIVMVSDPIDRYRKRLTRMRAQARSDDAYLYMADATGRGHYGTQLRQLLAFNDRDRVLVLQSERCAADPLGEYARTCRFLGIDDGFAPRKLRRRVARRTEPRVITRVLRAVGLLPFVLRFTRSDPQLDESAGLWPDIEAALHDDLDGEVATLTELVPDIDLALWPNFAPEGASDRS